MNIKVLQDELQKYYLYPKLYNFELYFFFKIATKFSEVQCQKMSFFLKLYMQNLST